MLRHWNILLVWVSLLALSGRWRHELTCFHINSSDVLLVSLVHLQLTAVVYHFLIPAMHKLLRSCYLKVPISDVVLLSVDPLQLVIAHRVSLVNFL